MVTCRETVGDGRRSMSQTSFFQQDRRCSRLPTDTTVTNETELNDTASVSITNRAPLIVSEHETHRPHRLHP
jgi:hypothetical protein